jgi:hypothetical protein
MPWLMREWREGVIAVAYLENLRKPPEGEPTLRPFGKGTSDVLEIGDAPFHAVANQ